MQVLWLMSPPGRVGGFEPALRGLADRGHRVHVAFARHELKGLRLEQVSDVLSRGRPSITSGAAPRIRKDDAARVSGLLRASLDRFGALDPAPADARRPSEDAAPPVRGGIEQRYQRLPAPGKSVMRGAFRLAERSTPLAETVVEYLQRRNPDVVLATPLLGPGSWQVEFLRAAKHLGIPTALCVGTWDDLTCGAQIHEPPDATMVWDEFQREEAVQRHQLPAARVVVTGAAPYDDWLDRQPSRKREEFATAVGIDSSAPFVLYVGSPRSVVDDEAGQILDWVRGLEREGLEQLQVLACPHRANPLVGKQPSQLALAALETIHVAPPLAADSAGQQERRDYFDSIYHCAAVVGVHTSALRDAGIVGRPAFTTVPGRDGYAEHAAELRRAFAGPSISPRELGRPSSPHLVRAIEELATHEKDPTSVVSRNPIGRGLSRIARGRLESRSHRGPRSAEPFELDDDQAPDRIRKFVELTNDPTVGAAFDLAAPSSTLLVAFGGMPGHMGMQPFEFFNVSRDLDVKKAYLRDLDRAWYHAGVRGFADSPQGVAERLRGVIRDTGANKVVFAGNSAGGWAALLFGALVDVDLVLAFAPQTTLRSEELKRVNDTRWDRALHRARRKRLLVEDLLDLRPVLERNQPSADGRRVIHYASSFDLDAFHAERLDDLAGVELVAHNGGKHGVIRELRATGALSELLAAAVEQRPKVV